MDTEQLGIGSQLWLSNSLGVLTKLDGLLNVNRPNLSVESLDTTDHDSPDAVREFSPGLGDPGELAATLKYVPGSATDTLILEHLASREKRAFKIVTVNSDGTEDNEGTVFLTGYEPDNAPVDANRQATLSGKVSGAMTQAPTV